jgi:hypothetical protein
LADRIGITRNNGVDLGGNCTGEYLIVIGIPRDGYLESLGHDHMCDLGVVFHHRIGVSDDPHGGRCGADAPGP